jgi:hypothetical protein
MSARTIVGRGSLVLVVLMGLMGLAGCLPVPLGDPSRSKADSRFFGVWEWRDGRVHRAVIRPWDERTFVVDVLTGELLDDGGTRPRERDVYKAWLTDIQGATFMTLQPIDVIGSVNGDSRASYYIVAKVALRGTTLTATAVDPEYKDLKNCKTREELEKIVTANIDDPKLFTGAPQVMKHWGVEQMQGLEKLQQTFHDWK